jgi:hypothetical protein
MPLLAFPVTMRRCAEHLPAELEILDDPGAEKVRWAWRTERLSCTVSRFRTSLLIGVDRYRCYDVWRISDKIYRMLKLTPIGFTQSIYLSS